MNMIESKTILRPKAHDLLKLEQQIDTDMKTRLTDVFNQASTFFWYPPANLLNEGYVVQKHKDLMNNNYPGNGLSYT